MRLSVVREWWGTLTAVVRGAVVLGITLLSVVSGVALVFSLRNPWIGISVILAGLSIFALSYAHRARTAITREPPRRRVDRELYRRLVELLPSDAGVIDYFLHGDISYVPDEVLSTLRRFRLGWDNAEHEFHDAEIEAARIELLRAVGAYLETAAGIIGPVHLDDPQSPIGIPREWKGQGDGSRYYEAYAKLEQAADLILAKHQAFVRTARSRLEE